MLEFLAQSDNIGRLVALLLLLMSVASWVMIFWKAWLLARIIKDVRLAIPAFWQAPDLKQAAQRVEQIEREAAVSTLVAATRHQAAGSLASAGDRGQQLTRVLRGALHQVLGKLHFGQSLLATTGAISPFIGLFGTVWGIYHALVNISNSGQMSIAAVAGPIGEALVATAAGLFVAIPAVLAYNALVRGNKTLSNELDSFAHDLHAQLADKNH